MNPTIFKNFQQKIRPQILVRDGFTCQYCLKKSESLRYRDLIIHHVDRKGNHKPNPNNDPKNLVTLCKPCHSREHYKEIVDLNKDKFWTTREKLIVELKKEGQTY